MRSTTDQPVPSREDRPPELTDQLHRESTARPPVLPKPSRKTLGWSVLGVVGVAAAVVTLSVLLDRDSTDRTVNDDVVTRVAVDNRPTELDIRGIPTSWSGEPAAPQRNGATELDIRGIPTSWSGEPAAP